MRHLACLITLLSLAATAVAADDEAAALFNDKDLTGWEAVGGPLESWSVDDDGVLRTTGEGGGWLSTTDEYGDFELSLEFRVPADGNSGVFIRAPREGSPWIDGMEIQVLDDYAEIHKSLEPYQYCASVYGVAPAMPRVSKPAGEWQTLAIRCQGTQVSTMLNGTVVVETDLADHGDKVESHPGIQRPRGYIGLQNHGTPMEFRNIRLQVLESSSAP
jgi:hypothetical protein